MKQAILKHGTKMYYFIAVIIFRNKPWVH